MPAHFSLAQNYPNPFNSSTTISFELIESRKVSLKVYNIIGEKVATLIDKELNAGHHEVRWEPSGLASGLYYYVLSDDSRRQTKQMVLLK
jgi:flagellar hook assembly protein FlgD